MARLTSTKPHSNTLSAPPTGSTTSSPQLTKSQLKNRAKKAKRTALSSLTETQRREHGYLRTAGLDSKNAGAPITLSPDSSELKFARNLGAPNQKMRHRTAIGLKKYIKARSSPSSGSGFSEFDFMKLQKALFYCVWLADKVPVQEELTDLIAPLLHACGGGEKEDIEAGEEYLRIMKEEFEEDGKEGVGEPREDEEESDDDDEVQFKGGVDGEDSDSDPFDPYLHPHCAGVHLSTVFLATFFRTISREWGGIDQYRLDKIYSLIRKVIRQMYEYIAMRGFHPGVVAQFNDVLVEEVLEKTPNGLRFHVIDIALDELAKVDCGFDTESFVSMMEPFTAVAQAEQDKFVRGKVFENVFLKFLVKYSTLKDSPEVEDEDDEVTPTFENVDVKEVSKLLFQAASGEATIDPNRRQIYDMQKTYEKRIRKRAPEPAQPDDPPKNKAGSKRKTNPPKKRQLEEAAPEPKSPEPETSETTPPKKKRRASVDITEMRDSDEDYKSPSPPNSSSSSEQKRRVSFGKNKSKSWTKSMNDMHKKDVIISPKPKRGILSNKDAPVVVITKDGKNRGSRKSKRNGGH
mmetsp:Transcript_24593/g.46215  ORF Transcript_24593/g.46215 Transcript_24593/m.46215 type:complete len:575 (-) Transcript_24593:63-1787(-)